MPDVAAESEYMRCALAALRLAGVPERRAAACAAVAVAERLERLAARTRDLARRSPQREDWSASDRDFIHKLEARARELRKQAKAQGYPFDSPTGNQQRS